MTVGNKSGQPGNIVPLQGESEIRQTSTGVDVLTITYNSSVTSTAGGKALVVKRTAAAGSSLGTELLTVDYDGSHGRRHLIALSSASTAITIAASQSGSFLTIPAFTSAATLTLPAMEAGLWYEFYVAGALTSGVLTISAATAGDMVVFNDVAANSVVLGKAATASGTTIGGSVRVVTDGTKWYTIMQPAFTSAAPTSLTMTELAIVT